MSQPVAADLSHDQPRPTIAVQAIIALELAIVFVQHVVYDGMAGVLAFEYHSFATHPWTALTYMLAHDGLWQLVVNMYALYLFGPRLERLWGAKRFVWFFVICGLGGVVFELLFIRTGSLVGATAAVFGVMTAYAMHWADDELYLMFVMPVRVRALVVGYVVFATVLGVLATTDGPNFAYLAHVGGAFAAFVLVRMSMTPGIDQVRQRVAELPDVDEPPRAIPRTPPRRERGDDVDEIVAKSKAIAAKRVTSVAPRQTRHEPKSTDLDRVLDKISQHGIESLTSDERRVLEEMSKRLKGE